MCDRALRRRSPEGIELGKAAPAPSGRTSEAEGAEDPQYHEERKADAKPHRTCLVSLDTKVSRSRADGLILVRRASRTPGLEPWTRARRQRVCAAYCGIDRPGRNRRTYRYQNPDHPEYYRVRSMVRRLSARRPRARSNEDPLRLAGSLSSKSGVEIVRVAVEYTIQSCEFRLRRGYSARPSGSPGPGRSRPAGIYLPTRPPPHYRLPHTRLVFRVKRFASKRIVGVAASTDSGTRYLRMRGCGPALSCALAVWAVAGMGRGSL